MVDTPPLPHLILSIGSNNYTLYTIGKMLLVQCTGVQISLKMLPTCTSIQKSQPTFPNPARIKGGTGQIIRGTHIVMIFLNI